MASKRPPLAREAIWLVWPAVVACAQPSPKAPPPAAAATTAASATIETTSANPSVQPLAAADSLGVHSQADCPSDMVFVPEGTLVFRGPLLSDPRSAPVSQTLKVEAFCIDRREVGSVEFRRCEPCRERRGSQCGTIESAASCMRIEQAQTYCEHGVEGVVKRLPTAKEWLYAAIGPGQQRFPWGDTWFPWGNDRSEKRPSEEPGGRYFCDLRGPHEGEEEFAMPACSLFVDSMDHSSFGVQNMGSNVLEWVADRVSLPSTEGRREAGCVANGIDHSGLIWEAAPADSPPPSDVSLFAARVLPCQEDSTPELSADPHIGFRCVASPRQALRVGLPASD